MVLTVLAVPVLWMFVLWTLSRLEEMTLAPVERAATISELLEMSDPEEIERMVSELLATSMARPSRKVVRAAARSPETRVEVVPQ